MATAIKIKEKSKDLNWSYDAEADVLYVTLGRPREAIGVDVGDGTILRYDDKSHEVVGITFVGLQSRLLNEISSVPTRKRKSKKGFSRRQS